VLGLIHEDRFIACRLNLFGLPGVSLGRFTARTREDLIETFQGFFSERDFRGAQGRFQLFDCSGPDDGCGHHGVVQKPGQGHGGRRFAQLFAQSLVLFEPGSIFVNFLEG
jgi:hypothetical protein